MDAEKLKIILDKHLKWLKNEAGGALPKGIFRRYHIYKGVKIMVIAIVLHGDKVEMVRGETIAEVKPAVAKVFELLQGEVKGE